MLSPLLFVIVLDDEVKTMKEFLYSDDFVLAGGN